MQQSKFKKDYLGGALMVVVGLSAVYAAMGYRIGTLSQMGPGFFPAAVGSLLAFMGLLIALAARSDKEVEDEAVQHAHPTSFPDIRAGICIILSILAFLLFGHYGGLIPATFAITFISALGDRTNTVMQAFVLSVMMCVISFVVFWWALQLQLPLFQWGG
jgi:uncharacterized membrane protein